MEMFLTVSATSAAVGRLAVFGDLDVPSDWAFKSTGPLVGLSASSFLPNYVYILLIIMQSL